MVVAFVDERPMVASVLSYSLQCEVDYNAAEKEICNCQTADSQDCCDDLSHCQTTACFLKSK